MRLHKFSMGALVVLTAALLASTAYGQGASYTLDGEFDGGILSSLQYDTVADQLQLSETSETKPYIYIANWRHATVSKVDTNTGFEVARYPTCLNNVGNTDLCPPTGTHHPHYYGGSGGPAPSRTAVDLNGDVWVANRAFNWYPSITKIAGDFGNCVDRNGNGIIETSMDSSGNGRIDLSEQVNMAQSGTGEWKGQADECVLFTIQITDPTNPKHVYNNSTPYNNNYNALARGLTIDGENNVWVGMYNTGIAYKLDNDGTQLGKVKLTGHIYGLAADALGNIYNSEIGNGRIHQIDAQTLTVKKTIDLPWSTYGIAVEGDTQIVWLANWQAYGGVIKVDFNTNQYWLLRNPMWGNWGNTRGVAIDADGKIWVSNWHRNQVARLNPANNVWEANYNTAQGPIGVGIDSNEKVWTANYYANNGTRIDPLTGQRLDSKTLGVYPYSYSDMTGFQLTNSVVQQGTWKITYDSGIPGLEWGTIFWNEGEGVCPDDDCTPDGTEIEVKFRAADTFPVVSSWQNVDNGVGVSGILGQYVEIQVTLRITGGGDLSPVLKDLRLEPANQAPECATAGALTATCTGGQVSVTVDGSASSDADGDTLTYSWSAGTCAALEPIFGGPEIGGGGVVISNGGGAVTIATFLAEGTCAFDCAFALEVSDGKATASCTQALAIVDGPPTLTGIADAAAECNDGAGGVAASDAQLAGFFAGPAGFDACSDSDLPVLNNAPAVFPLGGTAVAFETTDMCDNTVAGAGSVTVADTTGPDATFCPADDTLVLDEFTCTAGASYEAAAADACVGALGATYAYAFDFPGAQSYLYTFADGSGNGGECAAAQTVTAIDTTAPVVVECPADATLELDALTCTAAATYLAAAEDACYGTLAEEYLFSFDAVGSEAYEYVLTDGSGNVSACGQTVNAIDVTAPELFCNALETITPPDAPISFAATATDNCDTLTAEITGFDCYKFKKDGSKQSKLESCVVSFDGDTLTISDSGGVNDNIEWYVTVTDAAGNTTETTCHTLVINPGNGGGDDSACNQGVGNGPEACDPGNSNQGDPDNTNDEDGGTPGNPGKKGGKKK